MPTPLVRLRLILRLQNGASSSRKELRERQGVREQPEPRDPRAHKEHPVVPRELLAPKVPREHKVPLARPSLSTI